MAQPLSRRIAPHIAVVNGTPTTTSRDIAETFGKSHKDVLKRIQSLECSPAFRERNFAPTFYDVPGPNGAIRQETEYRITRDGFAFLCMGFTGSKAAKWKERYIATFNRLADKVAARVAPKAAPAALPSPSIDVRALMLSGQSEPVPLLPAHQALVDAQAWLLAREAYELARQHIARRVAYTSNHLERTDPNHPRVAQVVSSVTLGNALAHRYHSQIDHVATLSEMIMKFAQENSAKITKEIEAFGLVTVAH